MLPTIHKDPVEIVSVDNTTFQITWKINELRNVLSKSHGKLIKIIILIGAYQTGKTTFISLTFGNDKHKIGNSFDETTNGAKIDGPYTIKYLKERWNIQLTENINDDTDIYVIDIEGFGGYERGHNDEEHQNFYTKLIVPFISIASCIVCIANSNEIRSTTSQIISAFRFGEYGININNSSVNSTIILMTLIRNVDTYEGIDYTNPNQNTYEQISSLLVKNWQKRFLRNTNCTASTKPLPQYLGNNPFSQSSQFYNGFKFVVKDICDILFNQKMISTRNIDTICNNFNRVREFIESFNFESIRISQNDFFMQSIYDNIDYELNNMKPSIEAFFNDYQEKQRQLPLTNKIELNLNIVSENISNKYIEIFTTYIHRKFNSSYFLIPDVINYLSQKKVHIKNQINRNMPQLIGKIKDNIIESINNIVKSMDPSLQTYINMYINNENYMDLLYERDLNEDKIQTFLYEDYTYKLNQFLHQKINDFYFERSEFNPIFNEYNKQIKELITKKLSEIVKIKYTIVEEKGKHIFKNITNHITNGIDRVCDNLMSKSILEYLLTDENEFYSELYKIFISIANESINLNINKCYHKVESIQTLKETMIKDIDSYIIKVRPGVMYELKKKRVIQIAARITFGAAATIAAGACLGAGFTAAALNAIAETPSGALAISGAGAIKVGTGAISLGVTYGSMVGTYGAPIGAIICGVTQPDKTYIIIPDLKAVKVDH